MFKFKKSNKDSQYILILPSDGGNFAEWELLENDELEERAQKNEIPEGARLFRVDQEVKIRFEKSTHIED